MKDIVLDETHDGISHRRESILYFRESSSFMEGYDGFSVLSDPEQLCVTINRDKEQYPLFTIFRIKALGVGHRRNLSLTPAVAPPTANKYRFPLGVFPATTYLVEP